MLCDLSVSTLAVRFSLYVVRCPTKLLGADLLVPAAQSVQWLVAACNMHRTPAAHHRCCIGNANVPVSHQPVSLKTSQNIELETKSVNCSSFFRIKMQLLDNVRI